MAFSIRTHGHTQINVYTHVHIHTHTNIQACKPLDKACGMLKEQEEAEAEARAAALLTKQEQERQREVEREMQAAQTRRAIARAAVSRNNAASKQSVWDNRGPSAAGLFPAEHPLALKRAYTGQPARQALDACPASCLRFTCAPVCSHLRSCIRKGMAEALAAKAEREERVARGDVQGQSPARGAEGGMQGGGTKGRGKYGNYGWRRQVCRRVDLQVQWAEALEAVATTASLQSVISLRQSIRDDIAALLPPQDGELGIAEGIEEEGEEDLRMLLTSCDSAVERCTALLVQQALSGAISVLSCHNTVR